MEKARVKLVFPRAEEYRDRPQVEGGRMLTDLRHKVIAFVDDGRPNAGIALASVREEMVSAFHIRPVLVEHRALGISPCDPLPREVFQPLVNEVDAVVIGLAS